MTVGGPLRGTEDAHGLLQRLGTVVPGRGQAPKVTPGQGGAEISAILLLLSFFSPDNPETQCF